MKHFRINVVFDNETYKQIRLIADRNHCSMSEVVRGYTRDGLNGALTGSNLDYISSVLREQLRIVLRPSIDRLASLSAKTCIQASTSAYLNAEALARLVPVDLQMDLEEAYCTARKKAVLYTRNRLDNENPEE